MNQEKKTEKVTVLWTENGYYEHVAEVTIPKNLTPAEVDTIVYETLKAGLEPKESKFLQGQISNFEVIKKDYRSYKNDGE